MKIFKLLLLFVPMMLLTHQVSAQITPEFDEYIETRMSVERIPGMSIAIIHDDGSVTYHNYGFLNLEKNRHVDEFTIFEAGSVTKTFTAGLLSILMDQYSLSPDTPLVEIFGDDVSFPSKDGIKITLKHLASHTSGLPRLPGNINTSDNNDPYSDYTPQMLFEFLSNYELTRTPGEEFEYSNLAFMLLGETLQEITGQPYHDLIEEWFTKPVDMPSTSKFIVDSLRFTQPTSSGISAQRWHSDHVSGFGELLSNSHDLTRYIKIHLGHLDYSKKDILNQNLQNLNPVGGPFNMGNAWIVATAYDDTVAFHGGGTGGYRSFVGYSPVTKRGAVVLTNATNDVQDIGRHLINSNYALADITEVFDMTAEQLNQFTGEFASETFPAMVIQAEKDQLMAVLAGQPPMPFVPIDQTTFSNERIGAWIEFHANGDQIIGFQLRLGENIHRFEKRE